MLPPTQYLGTTQTVIFQPVFWLQVHLILMLCQRFLHILFNLSCPQHLLTIMLIIKRTELHDIALHCPLCHHRTVAHQINRCTSVIHQINTELRHDIIIKRIRTDPLSKFLNLLDDLALLIVTHIKYEHIRMQSCIVILFTIHFLQNSCNILQDPVTFCNTINIVDILESFDIH